MVLGSCFSTAASDFDNLLHSLELATHSGLNKFTTLQSLLLSVLVKLMAKLTQIPGSFGRLL